MDATRGASSELRNHRRSALSARLSGVWTMSVLRPPGDGDLGTRPAIMAAVSAAEDVSGRRERVARSLACETQRKKGKKTATTITFATTKTQNKQNCADDITT